MEQLKRQAMTWRLGQSISQLHHRMEKQAATDPYAVIGVGDTDYIANSPDETISDLAGKCS